MNGAQSRNEWGTDSRVQGGLLQLAASNGQESSDSNRDEGTMQAGLLGAGLALGAALFLTGCAGFFVDPHSTSTTTGTSGSDYVYVVNQTTNTLTGFVVGTGTLTTISTYTLQTGLNAQSVAVTIPDTFVYVGGSGGIYCYAIGTGGALTQQTTGGVTELANFVAMDVSYDGKWLAALDSDLDELYIFSINTSTGLLSPAGALPISIPGSGTGSLRQVRFSPNAAFVVAALGPGGDVIYPFNATTGALGTANNLTLAAGFSDNAIAFDKVSGDVYFARGGSTTGSSVIATYTLGSSGALTQVGTPIVSGNSPYSLLNVDTTSSGDFLYAANRNDSTISGYSLTSGALAALASSPYNSGSAVTALVLDKTGAYVIAASSGGSPDVELYALDGTTLGKLDSDAISASGTDPAGSLAIAATH
jgi:6-phosphogluconolactonase (cycloisomerase 2 family)